MEKRKQLAKWAPYMAELKKPNPKSTREKVQIDTVIKGMRISSTHAPGLEMEVGNKSNW